MGDEYVIIEFEKNYKYVRQPLMKFMRGSISNKQNTNCDVV